MNDSQKKSYELATEVTKQLLTLSSATLAFAAMMLRDLEAEGIIRVTIVACYISLFISILSGIRVLYAITAVLDSIECNDDDAVPIVTKNPSARKYAFIQHAAFGTGLLLLTIFGLSKLLLPT